MGTSVYHICLDYFIISIGSQFLEDLEHVWNENYNFFFLYNLVSGILGMLNV